MQISDLRSVVAQYLRALDWPMDAPTTGNQPPECPDWRTWPRFPTVSLLYVLDAIYQLTAELAQAGRWEPPTTTGIFRCPPANARRGGTEGSRHQFGARPGKLYGAADLRFAPWQVEILRRHAARMPQIIRSITGWQEGVGFIIYSSGLVHLDLRERPDWIDVQ